MSVELGGFAESPEVIDSDFEAFNICLAEDYFYALLIEDFEMVGNIGVGFF